MSDNQREPSLALLGNLLPIGSILSWLEPLVNLWKMLRKALRGMADEGMYEVLAYESTLELLDPRGERAQVRKYERVRYLQNHIVAYQDEAWGDGEILINYHCTPGIPVDRYRPGKKTHILISLREVKNRGDTDEFHIEWEMRNGFRRATELWEAQINHRMNQFKIQVIFPQSRPPRKAALIEGATRRAHPLGPETCRQLPDGRWQVYWETNRPRLHETYSLQWEW